MAGEQILVFSNDVVPGMGLPVAAPGLRAWGLAAGLRAHGHAVTLAVNETVVRRVWRRPLPPPIPSGAMLVQDGHLSDLVRVQRPWALIVTNSNHAWQLGDVGDTRLIYDFFAPKVLELEQEGRSEEIAARVESLRRRKLSVLQRSDGVIINGAKKVSYVLEWLQRASGDLHPPWTVVNMPLPVDASMPADSGPLHAVVTGYVQPWSLPGKWADAVVPFIEEGSVVLHLLVNRHWGGGEGDKPLPETYQQLASLPGVRQHGLMEFGDFRRFLQGCHLSFDLFARNPERELAMVTRTAVALSCGVPVIHVPFTETSEFVRQYGAGWLVESDDTAGIRAALQEATSRRSLLTDRRDCAFRAARELFDPAVATRPLHEILESLR